MTETDNEKTDQLITDIGKAAGVDISVGDIDRSHRMGVRKAGTPRQLVAKFTTFNKRQQLYEGRKDLRSGRLPNHAILTAAVLSKTYLADSLSKRNARTMFVARQLKRKGVIARAWTDSCTMKIKIREGAPTRKITCTRDLLEIAGDDPDVLAALREEGDVVPVPADDTEAGAGAVGPAGAVTRSRSVTGRRP